MSLKCVVIDDEKAAVELLTDYIQEFPGLTLFKSFRKPLIALAEIKEEDEIDVILLDIDMPGLSGLELAKSLRNKTRFLIFTTAHRGHGQEAFDVKASHYLLKPIPFPKFAFEMDRLIREKAIAQGKDVADLPGTAFIKGSNKNNYIPVDMQDINYVEALRNYVKIFINPNSPTKKDVIVTYISIGEMDKNLDPSKFIRISRSFIVSKKNISAVEGNTVVLKDGLRLDVGGHFKDLFFEYIRANVIKPLPDKGVGEK